MYGHKQSSPVYATAGTVGGTANEAAMPATEIRASVDRLESRLSSLIDAVDALDNRLTGYVARTSPPTENKPAQIRGAMQTGLGTTLDTLTEHTERAADRVRDLIQRLEV